MDDQREKGKKHQLVERTVEVARLSYDSHLNRYTNLFGRATRPSERLLSAREQYIGGGKDRTCSHSTYNACCPAISLDSKSKRVAEEAKRRHGLEMISTSFQSPTVVNCRLRNRESFHMAVEWSPNKSGFRGRSRTIRTRKHVSRPGE